MQLGLADGGASKGSHSDLGGSVEVGEETHAEEGPEDSPVELPEEG